MNKRCEYCRMSTNVGDEIKPEFYCREYYRYCDKDFSCNSFVIKPKYIQLLTEKENR